MKRLVWMTALLSLAVGVGAVRAEEEAASDAMEEHEEELDELRSEIKSLRETVESVAPGSTKFVITGYSFAGFTDREKEDSTFSAGFFPIFLWKISDRLFFEGEPVFELEDDETEVELEYAHVAYLLNDYVTFGAGKFLSPMNVFTERLHPAWINKLPDRPLAFEEEGGLLPGSHVGAQARGGFDVGPTKLNYALFVSNGGALNTGEAEAEEAGLLEFENFSDTNDSKAVGGRIGFFPVPELEVGYGLEWSEVDPTESSVGNVDALLHAVDLNYVRDSEILAGTIDARFQWAWSRLDTVTFDPDGALGFGPLRFDNDRDGGYAQLAYRPAKLGLEFLRDCEAVLRWDALNAPDGAPESADRERWTIGLNYWLGASTVLKVAYQFDDRDQSGGAEAEGEAGEVEGVEEAEAEERIGSRNAVMLQFAIGF